MLVVALRRTAIERDFSLGKVFLFHRRSLYDMVIYHSMVITPLMELFWYLRRY